MAAMEVGEAGGAGARGEGLGGYYRAKIESLEIEARDRAHDLRRLEAQRNSLNTRVRLLREELQLLQEPGSYVGEVVKVMGKTKVRTRGAVPTTPPVAAGSGPPPPPPPPPFPAPPRPGGGPPRSPRLLGGLTMGYVLGCPSRRFW